MAENSHPENPDQGQPPTQRELSQRAFEMKKAAQAANEKDATKTANLSEAETAKSLAQAGDAAESFFPARQVWERYRVSEMTLWRWVNNDRLGFPQPIYIGRFRYWRASELVTWERARAAGRDNATQHREA